MAISDRPQRLFPLVMALCEGIDVEIGTRRLSLHGLLGAVTATSLPLQISFFAYACFTSVREKLEVRFQILDLDDNVLTQSPITTVEKPADPTAESVAITKFNVEFSEFGHYFVRLTANDEYIMERRLTVAEPPEPTESRDE